MIRRIASSDFLGFFFHLYRNFLGQLLHSTFQFSFYLSQLLHFFVIERLCLFSDNVS